jgi:hypothetical protein
MKFFLIIIILHLITNLSLFNKFENEIKKSNILYSTYEPKGEKLEMNTYGTNISIKKSRKWLCRSTNKHRINIY